MVHMVFSVEDVKSGLFGPPMLFAAKGQAVRAFKDIANTPESMIAKHPDDYRLVQVATFDDESGTFAEMGHLSLGFASEYRTVVEVPTPIRAVEG